MRLVLDTDVVVSGLQSQTGASRLPRRAVFAGAVCPLVTVATVLEHEEVLLRPRTLAATRLTAADTLAFLDGFVARAEHVIVSRRHRPSIRDPADEILVEALRNGGVDAIVTFNLRDDLVADDRGASRGQTTVPAFIPGEIMRRLIPAARRAAGKPLRC